MNWIKRHGRLLVSIAVVAATFGYCAHVIDLAAFWRSLSGIDAVGFMAVMGLYTLGLLAADTLAVRQVFSSHVQPIGWREVFVLRGASYGPSAVNYHLGQASLTWLLSAVRGAPLWRVAGATLLGYATMFGGLVVLALFAPVLAPGQLGWLEPVLAALLLAAAAYFALLRWGPSGLRRWEAVALLAEAGLRGHLVALAWRMPHILVLFVGFWLPLGFFEIRVPLAAALALLPPLLLVAALPLTPQGIGTRELLAIHWLSAYAPGEPAAAAGAVAAASLGWAVALSIWEVVIGAALAAPAHRILERARRKGE